jgi:hypothetical protein
MLAAALCVLLWSVIWFWVLSVYTSLVVCLREHVPPVRLAALWWFAWVV